MMVYPILAAQHARRVDRVFLSTDAPPIARVARHHGVPVIDRPAHLQKSSVTLEQILAYGYQHMSAELGLEIDAVVLLLCNAPTVTAGLMDRGIEILLENSSWDAVMSVSPHPEYRPQRALKLGEKGDLETYLDASEPSEGSPQAYFPDALVWVVRPRIIENAVRDGVRPNCIVNCESQRVFPLIHSGYGDLDHEWQIPAAEEWLRRNGFSETATPYDRSPVATPLAKPAARPAPSSLKHRPERVLVTTVPFGEVDCEPLRLLDEAGIDYVINPIGRKLKANELGDLIESFSVLIAGTETIDARVMDRAPLLRLISRVGVGLDNVDLRTARERGIRVAYTPEAPAPAVAELAIGLMLSLLRSIPYADRGLRNGAWQRVMGRRLSELTVGVIGVGRIGKRVIRLLDGFLPSILANDLHPHREFGAEHFLRWVDKETIFRNADIITLHLPLTPQTQNLITRRELDWMRPEALLINTSRGNMIDEQDLAEALRNHRIGGAAIDVFQQEPYSGELATLDHCVLTCHMGSMSVDCRARMELEATQEVLRFLQDQPMLHPAPEDDFAAVLA